MNAVLGLVKFGLSRCFNGIGTGTSYQSAWNCGDISVANMNFDPVSNALYFLSVNETRFPGAQTAADIVNELDILLTGGRSSSESLSIIETVFNYTHTITGNTTAALRMVQGAFALAPEFQIVGGNARKGQYRPVNVNNNSGVSEPGDNRPYKAIVYLFMNGGADSFNFLVPHSGCVDRDLYTEYSNVRTNMAIAKDSLLQINASVNESGRSYPQPCSRFGMHPSMQTVHRWYNDGDALWLANTGPLKEPIADTDDFENKTKRPPNLFAHNVQQRFTQTLDASDTSRTDGVLGRMQEKLKFSGYKTGLFSIQGMEATVLQPSTELPFDVMSERGVSTLADEHSAFYNISMMLTEKTGLSPFTETWSNLLKTSLERSTELSTVLDSTDLELDWNPTVNSDLADQLSQVAKIIKASSATNGPSLDSERDVFFTSIGGWDVHSDGIAGTEERLNAVDAALATFEAEMKAQGKWDSIIIVQASDFGRTLTSNGEGVDHAWGGNYFVGGGAIKGGKIIGQYPTSLLDDHPNILPRGRVLPSSGWESLFNAICPWFGLSSSDMAHVLPNLQNFPSNELFNVSDVFLE